MYREKSANDGWQQDPGVFVPTDRNVVLQTAPHYTDPRFNHAQTVFGGKQSGLTYVYDDRMWQWDFAKAEQAAKLATASGAVKRSAQWYDAWLSAYFEKPIEVYHIVAGINRSNDYSWCCFGYREVK